MCMEDIRIMRRTSAEERIVAVASAAVSVIVPANPNIVAITIDNQGPNDVTISLNPGVTAGNGILIQKSDPPIRRSLNQDGNAITRGIFGICSAAQTAVVVIWVSYLEDQ